MWMIWTALAAEPIALLDDGTLVRRIEWARPFQLAQPHPYRYTSEPREITEGWLVQVVVPSWTMMPRQVGVPNLWVGAEIAGRTAWTRSSEPKDQCAVFWVPGAHDLHQEPVFFGTTRLPERSDAAHRAAIKKSARGLAKLSVRTGVSTKILQFDDFGALMKLAKKRCAESGD